MNIVVFEDRYYNNFYPLSLTRPVWELRLGICSLRERIEAFASGNRSFFKKYQVRFSTREYIAPYYKERNKGLKINDSLVSPGEDIMFINSRVLPTEKLFNFEKNRVYIKNGTPLLAFVDGKFAGDFSEPGNGSVSDFLVKNENLTLMDTDEIDAIEYIWDLIELNPGKIKEDFSGISGKNYRDRHNSVTIIGDKNQLYVEKDVRIDPLVCIDLTEGPVVIKKGSVINSFTRLEGPCFIGESCHILGAKIRRGCTIGNFCRIGGEVEESIFHGYSNKYHDGFIGHSYIGEWVNMGALTTNSDLKNNYTAVKVYLPEKRVNTDRIKVGCFIGDFSKTSIGTLINTGSSLGVGSMIVYSGDMSMYHIPSFTWYINNEIAEKERFDSFLESCSRMMSRRGVEFSKCHSALLENVFELTEEKRRIEILKWKEKLR